MKIHIRPCLLLLATALMLMASCAHHPDVPSSCSEAKSLPAIFPDYCNVTVPCNIAPLNFMLPADQYEECVARLTTPDGGQQTYGEGVKVQIPESEWHAMLDASKGKSIKVEVWGKTTGNQSDNGNQKAGEWLAFTPFEIRVAEQPIDNFISYRLIEPSYIVYDYMEIAQRDITSFAETQIFNNKVSCDNPQGQCINCHSYQNYKTDNMLFHARVTRGGTVIVNDGKVSKVDLKRDYTISPGVYPAWHPTAKLVAFSTNQTHQVFHTAHPNKVEVFDTASDMILYDVMTDSVSIISNDSTLLEVFPTWSPDGKYLYYCKSVPLPEELRDKDISYTFQKIQYNIYRRSFDLASRHFGEEELVYDAASSNKSATLPRISPDGQYLLFALGQYGCFQIWHHDADIVCLPLNLGADADQVQESPSPLDLAGLNSAGFAESYPSWSSNGHWIMCASRRVDGNFSRVYISYFNNGKAEKAFLLPQEDPEQNTLRLKSYNRPEFMVEPVGISVDEFSKAFK
ncbi:MAG: PD40 domain-containing protein [Prevotella sp.]|nr:PD40 domain-containing protein [Prevotella sp.]